jgi:hypothetical protein
MLMGSLSTDANWVSQPGTEKALDYLFVLLDKNQEGQLRPTSLMVLDEEIPVQDLTKGQLFNLM